jgi:putative ABC transport system permease protein
MTLREIAYRNLLRRKGKAAFIVAGLLIGVATVVTVITLVDAMTADINHKLDQYGANILIVPKTESLALSYGGLSLGGVSFEMQEIRETELAQVRSIKNAANIAALGPMVLGVITINTHNVLLAGVDFDAARILKPWWKVDGALPEANGVLLGSESARIMQLQTNGQIEVNGQTLVVSGILKPTGSQDDQLVFTRLTTAQTLLGKPGIISMAEVAALCTACPIPEMVKQISAVLPGAKVMAIQQVVESRVEALTQFKKFSYGVSAIVLFVGGLVALVTMMGSVRERTEEIGIFRAIGFRKRHITQIVLTEAGIVSGLAGILGYLSGFAAAKIALRFFTANAMTMVPVNLSLAVEAFLLAILLGMAASVYPAMLAANLDPNEALRAL